MPDNLFYFKRITLEKQNNHYNFGSIIYIFFRICERISLKI